MTLDTPDRERPAQEGALPEHAEAPPATIEAEEAPEHRVSPPKPDPTVVGIGASAGGLAALKTFFQHVPEDSGLAFVVVVHLSPDHESHLADLLQPFVEMPVSQVTEKTALEANHVYVIPPNRNIDTIDSHLRLSPLEERRRERAPIDHFFRTLASTHDGRAIAVVLTGTGSDGTLGIKDIKEKGGLTVVQDPSEAEFDGMPQSAIVTGLVDLVLPLTEIPEAVLRFARTELRRPIPEDAVALSHGEDGDSMQLRLQSIIEENETSQEEMKVSNEELQTANEELRSTLEARRKELQSMNEELQTVNQENRHMGEELAQLSGDLQNLMAATGIATLFLDRDLHILRFTPRVGELFDVRPADRGRPLSDLTHHLDYDELQADAQRVLDRLAPVEREVQDDAGRWYLTRLLPYRSTEDRIEGVVITFVDITTRKSTEEALRHGEEQFRALVDASAQMVWATDPEGRVVEDSPSWRAFTGQTFDEWKGRGWLNVIHPEDRARAEAEWHEAIASRSLYTTEFRIYHAPSGDYHWTNVRAVPLEAADGSVRGWVGMNIDIAETKQAEEALRQSEERFRALFKESQDVILLANDEGLLVDANPAATDTLGYERDELLGKTIGDISDADERAFRTVWSAFLEAGEMKGEFQLRTRQGELLDMEFAAVANVLPGQHLSALRDVTERKRTLEALRRSEERLRVALGAVNMGVWSFEIASGAAERSERYYEIYGYEPSPEGAHLDDFYGRVHPDDLDRVRAAVEAGLRDERPYSETFRIVRPDGEIRWVHSEGRLVWDETTGAPIRMSGVVQDVTERQEAEEALRQSEERYRLLVEGATEYAILMLDEEGRITMWSTGARRLFGYPEAEAIGLRGDILFTDEDRAGGVPEKELATAAETGQANNDRWLARKEGSRFWASGMTTALYHTDGSLRGFAKVLRDNTERKQAEDALRELNETLEERVQRRTEQVRDLASTLAMAEQDERRRIAQILHDDLQQLLFGIQLKMSFVRHGAEAADADDLAEHTEESERFLDRAIQVTRQLTVDLSPPVLAGEGLTHALEWLTTQMQEVHNLSVEVLSGQPFVIPQEGMRVLLFQIVRELLFNVVKHAGTDRAIVTLDEEDGALVITVEDEGNGFDPATLQPRAEGGFGLFSVRERLRLFGGTLEIDAAPGQGTRMTATIPALLAPAPDR